jgi:hypothetical protein
MHEVDIFINRWLVCVKCILGYILVLINAPLRQDGISTAPGVVRRRFKLESSRLPSKYSLEFVAMPLGKGYTVEGQVTGGEVSPFPFHRTS